MKLAEALILRADSQKRLAQLEQRLLNNALVQAGDEPTEDPAALLREYEQLAEELRVLIERINLTNTRVDVEEGVSLTQALARRDVLRMRVKMYRGLASAATVKQNRYARTEIKFVPALEVEPLQKQADALSKTYRELDASIQATNWTEDLTE